MKRLTPTHARTSSKSQEGGWLLLAAAAGWGTFPIGIELQYPPAATTHPTRFPIDIPFQLRCRRGRPHYEVKRGVGFLVVASRFV